MTAEADRLVTEKCYVDTVRSTKLSMPHFYPKNRVHWRIKLILFFPDIFPEFAHALTRINTFFIYLMVLKEEKNFLSGWSSSPHRALYL